MKAYIDANIVIYAVTHDPKYGSACAAVLKDMKEGKLEAVASSLVVLEIMNALQRFNASHRRQLETPIEVSEVVNALFSLPIEWVDMTVLVMEKTLPHIAVTHPSDAVHLATMEIEGITKIITADHDFDRIDGVSRIDPLTWKA